MQKNDPLAARRKLRQNVARGTPTERSIALQDLLGAGGILLRDDEELLAQIDLMLAYDPINSPVLHIAAAQVGRCPPDRESLLERGRYGRIRDRKRAACILGNMSSTDDNETDQALLAGLLKDPVPAVWRAAARAVWHRRARAEDHRQRFEPEIAHHDTHRRFRAQPDLCAKWRFPADFPLCETRTRRHLASGLIGLAATHLDAAVRLLDELLHHEKPWIQASAAISCGEIAVCFEDVSAVDDVFELFLMRSATAALPSLATGIREAGRTTKRAPRAERLAGALNQALTDRLRGKAPDEWAIRRTMRLLQPVLDYRLAGPLPQNADYDRQIESVLRNVFRVEMGESFAALLETVDAGCDWLDRSAAACQGDDWIAAAADFSCIAEGVFGSDDLQVLCEVVARSTRQRRHLRRGMGELSNQLFTRCLELAESSHFLEMREGIRGLTLAVDSQTTACRKHISQLLRWIGSGKTRHYALGAIGRLLDKLYEEDPDGFVDIVARVACRPRKTLARLLKRLQGVTAHPMVSSFLVLLQESVAEVEEKIGRRSVPDVLDQLARRFDSWLARDPVFRTPNQHPAVTAFSGVAQTIWHLAGDPRGDVSSLPCALTFLATLESNRLWDEPLKPELDTLVERARRLIDSMTAAALNDLATALDETLASFLIPPLVVAMQRGAKTLQKKQRLERKSGYLPGDPIHDYFVVSCVHQSNLSRVYFGRHCGTRDRVVLKTPTEALCKDAGAKERFFKEAALLALLPSQHLVRVHAIHRESPALIVLQHVPGRSLDECLGQGRRWLLRRFLGVLRGIRNAHDYGIVHRDLKPGNIMVVPSGRAVVIDFGLSYLPEDFSQLTAEQNNFGGTPFFMAPEQWSGQRPTPATDVYALGVIVYRLLTRSYPFTGSNLRICYQHLNDEPPPVPDDVAPILRQTVRQCLAKDPQQRPCLEEIQLAVEDALCHSTSQKVITPHPPADSVARANTAMQDTMSDESQD
jgi:hypothetical protein